MAELKTTAPNFNMPATVPNPAASANSAAMANPSVANPDLLNSLLQNLNKNPTDANAVPPPNSNLNLDQQNPDVDKKPETNLKQSSSAQKFSRDFVSIGELCGAVPFVLSSFINQAENISKYGKLVNSKNTLSFFAYVVDKLSFVSRKLLNEVVSQREGENDVRDASTKSTLLGDFFARNIPYTVRRLIHPNTSKEFTSLLFTFRRVLFNMFPNTFIVPSDDRDSNNKNVMSRASLFSKTAFEASARILGPFRWISSFMAALTIIPANLFGVIFAYNGNQQLYNISKEFSKLTDLFTPVVSNLSSLYSSAKAFIDSYTRPGKETLSVSFGRYNISYLHVIQGSLGSLLSIPYFFGIFSRFKDILNSKDHYDEYNFVNHIKELVGECAPQIKSLGFFKHDSITKMQDKVGEFATKAIEAVNKYPRQVLESLFNSSSWAKSIFSKIRPVSQDGRVQAEVGPKTYETDDPKENYFLGLSRKIFFKEVFDLLHPIQSLLMLLPNAFVPLNDPYVADNAKRGLRILDRLIGINSMVLSAPNFLIYALSTRIPQIILKVNQMIFRIHEARGTGYDPNLALAKTIKYIKGLPLFGLNSYLAGVLEKYQETKINDYTFRDEEEMANLLENIEEDARTQEASVKSSELVGAMRIGLRTMLGKGWFFAQRDEATGYTDEEQSSMNIYKSLGTFKEGIYKFPVIGWIAGPLIEMVRRLYYIQPKTNIKRLSMV